MKVLHIGNNDFGGANASVFLHLGLLENGVDSNLLVLNQTQSTIPNSFCFPGYQVSFVEKLLKKAGIYIRKSDKNKRKLKGKVTTNYDIFSFPETDYDITAHPLCKEADIIHLHWVSQFLDYDFFEKTQKPVVWTLHDMNPFTGGCHHSSGCDKYQIDCRSCPQLKGTPDTENARRALRYKEQNLKRRKNIHIVPINQWMKRCSEKSALFSGYEHTVINNSIDLHNFKPENQKIARDYFGISNDKLVLGFVIPYYAKGKGVNLLSHAIQKFQSEYKSVNFVYIGHEYAELSMPNVKFLGKLSDKKIISRFYNALDALIFASLEDNFPTVLLEASACGIPSVANAVGGVPDIVVPGLNGILIDNPNETNLYVKLKEYMEVKDSFDSNVIRSYAEKKFNRDLQVNRYLEVYNKMLR